jgi:transcriptional regulator with XRE-family HTH domain
VKTLSDTAVKKTFGTALREARTAAGLSQMDLADRAGVHFTFVSSTERGLRNISLVSILKLARALGIPPKDLFNAFSPNK